MKFRTAAFEDEGVLGIANARRGSWCPLFRMVVVLENAGEKRWCTSVLRSWPVTCEGDITRLERRTIDGCDEER